jgi:peptidoglycan/xylan/chitin deacetylase (PgdA/CDA1 family)
MSPARSPRALVAAFVAVAGALLLSAGVFAWRALDAPPDAAVGENSSGYRPPADIPSRLSPASLAGVRVAVLETPGSEGFGGPGFHAGEVARWRGWLAERGAVDASPADADVLVLPHAVCVGDDVRGVLRRHLAAGRGVIASGPLGARDGLCRTRPDTLLVSLLGGRGSVAAYRRPPGESYYAVVLGESALGAGLPPGARMEIRPANQLVFRGGDRAVYFAAYDRRPVAQGGERWFDGAVARARVGPGRVAAFGFDLTGLAGGWSEDVARTVVANAVTWAAGRPVAHLAPWPRGKRAAAVVAQDVEADYRNARGAAELLQRREVPTTFFLVGSLAEANPRVTTALAGAGEIGSHTWDHRAVDALTGPQVAASLADAKRRTEALAGGPIAGFRPPEERFTMETLRGWARAGGEYVFASNDGRAAAPEIVPLGRDTIVLLARSADDDFEVLERADVRDRGVMTREMMRQVDDVAAWRGLYIFSYHSHMFARDDLLPVVDALAKRLKADDGVWLARAGDVARWWRARDAVRVEPAADGASVTATNTGRTPFRGGVLLVDLPSGTQRRVALPDLAPGARVTIPLR